MKKLVLFITLLVSITAFKCSGSTHITGTVYDSADSSVMPGVTIRVKGTGISTVTDVKGAFELNVPDGKTKLIFTFIGFKTQTVAIGNRTSIKVYLKPSSMA